MNLLKMRLVSGLCAAWFCLNAAGEPSATRLYPNATLPLLTVSAETTPVSEAKPESEVSAVPSKNLTTSVPSKSALPPGFEPVAQPVTTVTTNGVPKNLLDLFEKKNGNEKPETTPDALTLLQQKLETARYLRTTRQAKVAQPMLVELLAGEAPENIQQSALLELAVCSQDENEAARAQQIYAQFLSKWPNDPRVPEILLRQGLLFRQMGLNNLALTKFYAVMTSALVLQNDRLEYYDRLVQQAQTEIAETHYTLGKYTEAADFFSRLLKQSNSNNKSTILYKLARCNSALGRYAETIANAQDFLMRFPEAPEQPEIRFHLALALKQLKRDNESLQQVLLLMREQRELTRDRPEVWAYWQQRAGNLIGNHLYREGDYPKALDVYLNLAQLDSSPAWQLPVKYQIAMTYERLWQPQKAAETYAEILNKEKELADNTSPSLKSVFEMARWRKNFIDWQNQAEEANRKFHAITVTNAPVTASLESKIVPIQ
ncbi:MAG: tetratricopeptide repeat protein [Akkermansiaceae bacterium]|nr:tetratricopeptide repeat protein [Verrucomicrobiales bacterium]